MSGLIKGRQAAQVAAALCKAGAKWTPIYRRQKDANGMPMGEPERIGCMLGVRYVRGEMSAITIDIPGVVVRPDTPRFEGMLANGCAMPEKGDALCIGGVHVRILDVMSQAPPMYVLTLET